MASDTPPGAQPDAFPRRRRPIAIWMSPDRTAATRNVFQPPTDAMPVTTTAARPAAGPHTESWARLISGTTRPPTMPATRPAMGGAPDASAMPRHSGTATRNTTRPAGAS